MGLPGAAVPAADGGLGLTETDLVPLLIEVGYAAVPLPVAETVLVAAPLLAGAGDPGGRLAGIVDGSVRVALAEPGGIVPYGQCADLVLSLDSVASLGSPGAPLSTVDGSRLVTRIADTESVMVTDDAGLIALAVDRATLAVAAQLIGLSRRMLELTVSYVGGRRQFGVPVGSFQAVKHKLADALLRLEFAEPAVLAAGWALAEGDPQAARDVSAAAVLAVEASREVAGTAIQCHGAIGYTVEYDLQLYAKRAWALAAGVDLDAHLHRIGAAIGVEGSGHDWGR
jgi:alkylation response protein AidB-like acyl-CoA dehydrogenase